MVYWRRWFFFGTVLVTKTFVISILFAEVDFLVLDREFDYLWLFAIVKKSQQQLLEIDHWRTEQKASTSNMSQFILFSQPENKSHKSTGLN